MMDALMILNAVRSALENGGQHILISLDGGVSIWPELKTATWVEEPDRENHWHCSVCGSVWGLSHKVMSYCPNCGAKIEEDK